MSQPKRTPTGEEIERLQSAILDGFEYADLKQMVRVQLDTDIEKIIPTRDQTFTEVSYNLVRYFASKPSGFVELALAAETANRTNPQLQTVATEFRDMEFDVLPLPDDWFVPGFILPIWAIIAIVSGILIVIGAVAFAAVQNSRQDDKLTELMATPTATPIPSPTPVVMPDGSLNIAVAEFIPLDDAVQNSGEAARLSKSIANFLDNHTKELANIIDRDVLIWGPETGIPPVWPGEEGDIAKDMNANVLIFGTVADDGGSDWRVAPKFYLVKETTLKRATGQADELFDSQYTLGAPIPYDPDDFNSPGALNQELNQRLEALVRMLIGLSYIASGQQTQFEKAGIIFEEIANDTEWGKGNNAGQEILYLFIGSVNFAQAVAIGSDSPEHREELLIAAREAYSQAIRLNPDYGRPYTSLGSTLFELARTDQDSDDCYDHYDWGLVEEAKEIYLDAMNLPLDAQSKSSPFEFHLNNGLGRIYYSTGICGGDPDAWQQAEAHFESALEIFDQNSNPTNYLVEAAAHAHTRTAMILLSRADEDSTDDGDLNFTGEDDITTSIDHFSQAYDLFNRANTERSTQHAKIIMPFYLTGLCMAGQSMDAQSILDEFSDKWPTPETIRQEILDQMIEYYGDQCIY